MLESLTQLQDKIEEQKKEISRSLKRYQTCRKFFNASAQMINQQREADYVDLDSMPPALKYLDQTMNSTEATLQELETDLNVMVDSADTTHQALKELMDEIFQ